MEITCTAQYQGFTPPVPQGNCAAQINEAKYIVKHRLKAYGCSHRVCMEKHKGRFACKFC